LLFLVAIATAGISAYQAVMLKRALDAQMTANLQSRQVDACADFLTVAPQFNWQFVEIDGWTGTFDEQMNWGLETENGNESAKGESSGQSGELAQRSMQRILELRANTLRLMDAALSGLYPFASVQTQQQVNQVKTSVWVMLQKLTPSSGTGQSGPNSVAAVIADLSAKCRAVMTGQNLGLI
jgi:hypothetical protein